MSEKGIDPATISVEDVHVGSIGTKEVVEEQPKVEKPVVEEKKKVEEPVKTEESEKSETSEKPVKTEEKVETEKPDLLALLKEKGLEFESEDDLMERLNHQPEELDEDIKLIAEAKKSGRSLDEILRIRTLNPENMGSEELIKFKFFQDKDMASLLKDDPNLANKMFARDYKSKYGILDKLAKLTDEDEIAEFKEEHGDEIEIAELQLEHDKRKASQAIEEQKKELTEVKGGISEEESNQLWESYQSDLKDFKEEPKFELKFEDGKTFNIGLDKESSKIFDEWANDPQSFFKEIGFGNDPTKINTEQLFPHLLISAALRRGVSDKLKKFILDEYDNETIEGQTRQIETKTDQDLKTSMSLEEQIADEFAKRRG